MDDKNLIFSLRHRSKTMMDDGDEDEDTVIILGQLSDTNGDTFQRVAKILEIGKKHEFYQSEMKSGNPMKVKGWLPWCGKLSAARILVDSCQKMVGH